MGRLVGAYGGGIAGTALATRAWFEVVLASQHDYALRFAATSQQEVAVPNITIEGDQYTVEAWVWAAPDMLYRQTGSIVGRHAAGDDCRGSLDITNGRLRLLLTTADGVYHELNAASLVPVAQWVHLAGVYDGHLARLYLNGRQTDSLAVTGAMTTGVTARGTRIGGYAGTVGGACWFDGIIDEVRLWSVVRTPAQLRANRLRPIGPQPGLVAYWRFDEGTGESTADGSGNGYPGTLTNYDGVGTPAWVPGVFTQVDTAALRMADEP